MKSMGGVWPLKGLGIAIGLALLACGCEETKAVRKSDQQLLAERQALAVRDLALENQKLGDQVKKLTRDLEAAKRDAEVQKLALDSMKKEKETLSSQVAAQKARLAELEKENARLNRLLQEAVENYNRLGKELEALKKSGPPQSAAPQAPPAPSPPKAAPPK